MSRRVLTPRSAALAKAQSRMAPGGRLWSETPIRPFFRPVGEAGEESVAQYPTEWRACTDAYLGTNIGGSPRSWIMEWWGNIPWLPDMTPSAIVEMRLTFAMVDSSIAWFQAVSEFLATGTTNFSAPFDPHYPFWNADLTACGISTGNMAIDITGGPFTVGQEVSFTFNADKLYFAGNEDSDAIGNLFIPPSYSTSEAWARVVSP